MIILSINARRIRVLAVLGLLYIFWQFIHGRFETTPESFGLDLGELLWLGEIGLIAIAAWGIWRTIVRQDQD